MLSLVEQMDRGSSVLYLSNLTSGKARYRDWREAKVTLKGGRGFEGGETGNVLSGKSCPQQGSHGILLLAT